MQSNVFVNSVSFFGSGFSPSSHKQSKRHTLSDKSLHGEHRSPETLQPKAVITKAQSGNHNKTAYPKLKLQGVDEKSRDDRDDKCG